METDTYDIDFFIKKFEAIPEHKWCSHTQFDGSGRHCVYGHCETPKMKKKSIGSTWGSLPNFSGDETTIGLALTNIFDAYGLFPAMVNNGEDGRYEQPSEKQRVLACLNDIKNGKLTKQ